MACQFAKLATSKSHTIVHTIVLLLCIGALLYAYRMHTDLLQQINQPAPEKILYAP